MRYSNVFWTINLFLLIISNCSRPTPPSEDPDADIKIEAEVVFPEVRETEEEFIEGEESVTGEEVEIFEYIEAEEEVFEEIDAPEIVEEEEFLEIDDFFEDFHEETAEIAEAVDAEEVYCEITDCSEVFPEIPPCMKAVLDLETCECKLEAVEEGGDCDDNNPCTTDEKCMLGVCAGTVLSIGECACSSDSDCVVYDDGDKCNGIFFCEVETCKPKPGSEVVCDPSVNTECSENVCDPESGICQMLPANENGTCEDGNKCTIDDYCLNGVCVSGAQKDCGDSDDCTVDTCVTENGDCLHEGPEKPVCKSAGVCSEGVGHKCAGNEYLCDYDSVAGYKAVDGDCDGYDNDCDGETDEEAQVVLLDGTVVEGVGKPCGKGKCEGGVTACSEPGVLYCTSEANASQEECNSKDDDCDGVADGKVVCPELVYYCDSDKDGFSSIAASGICAEFNCVPEGCQTDPGNDCDDLIAGVNPQAVEDCATGYDDNCDGSADSKDALNCADYFYDFDGDGFYFPNAASECRCQPFEKFGGVEAGDCDDASALINPDAVENCATTQDDDCDGTFDEKEALGCTLYYNDGDGDGFGAGNGECRCAPSGEFGSTNNLDCDDKSPLIKPGAAEDCDTIQDDDCNGSSNGENALNCVVFYYDSDNDGYGTWDSKCLCLPDGFFRALLTGDSDDSNPYVNPGKLEDCLTPEDDNSNGLTNEENAINCKYYYFDGDADGYGTADKKCLCEPSMSHSAKQGGDCNDQNGEVKPSADEDCSTVYDDNCNNLTNEQNATGCSAFYEDSDGDGFGSTVSKCLCAAAQPFTSQNSNDCHDGSANIKPGITEDCWTIYDDNCNQITNEKDGFDCVPYYFDDDGDGYGTQQSECWCAPSGKYKALQGGDCNDNDAAVKPGAIEKCQTIYDDNCNGQTNEQNASGCTVYYFDKDEDFYYSSGTSSQCWCLPTGSYRGTLPGDCNDNDKDIKPGMIEKCQTAYDDNCDGKTNEENAENCAVFYIDFDNDGFGDNAVAKCFCAQSGYYKITPPGNSDCNDNDATINPAALEICNGTDDNCSGITDEGDICPSIVFYCDGDGDGHVSSSVSGNCSSYECAPEGCSVFSGDDCDDGKSGVNAGALEDCSTDYDDDCDDRTNERDAANCMVFYKDSDGDGYGSATASQCWCAASGAYNAQYPKNNDCDDSNNEINPAANDICDGKDNNCNGKTDNSWIASAVDSAGDRGDYSSIATDGEGKVHISYRNMTDQDLMYATNASGDWVHTTLDSAGDTGWYTSIAVDSNGKAHVSYTDWTNKDLKYATNVSGNWETFIVDAAGNTGYYTSIALDGNGKAHISYFDSSTADLRYATNTAGSWSKVTIDSAGLLGYYTSIAVDSANKVHISYYDAGNKDLKYATNSSGSWKFFNLDSADSVGEYTSIAADSGGKIHISYYDKTNTALKYATNATGAWTFTLLDSAGDTGWYTSIATDAGDRIHIGYYDATNKDLRYAENISGSWNYSTVDAAGLTGLWTSIAIAPDGFIHISYLNSTNADLRYATDSKNICPPSVYYCDSDKDGFISSEQSGECFAFNCAPAGCQAVPGDDCDDADGGANPAAVENCGTDDDDNCNGIFNEQNSTNCILFYRDSDNDGYGHTSDSECWCEPAGSYKIPAPDNTDCNDANPGIKPGAVEYCMTIYDDNCNGTTNDESALNCIVFHYDKDSDGYYPDGADSKCFCGPSGYYRSTAAGDCDDTKVNVKPGVLENCATTYDDNCNLNSNEQNALNCSAFYFDGDGDGYYAAGAQSQCWCAPSGNYKAQTGGDCNDAESAIKPGVVENCATPNDDNCNSSINEKGSAGCQKFYYDKDGDGYYALNAASECWCAASGNYRGTQSGDCNDNNSAVKPGVAEDCGTTEDDNCSGSANEQDAIDCTNYFYDLDSDGYYAEGAQSQCWCAPSGLYGSVVPGDTDDNDPGVNPGNLENCSTPEDDDNNGLTNEQNAINCVYFYYDGDNDGYGTASKECWCAEFGIFRAPQTGDCNDGDAGVKPQVQEDCGTVYDDNCNGETNEEGAENCSVYYGDSDKDGFGSQTDGRCLCAPSGDYNKTANTDCDDSNGSVKPGAAEDCTTPYDDNCNGATNEEDASGCSVFFADSDSDGYGSSESKCLCSADGAFKANNSLDCYDSDGSVKPGIQENCSTPFDDNCDSLTNEINASNCTGYYYDLDGDGYAPAGASGQCWCAPQGNYRAVEFGDCDDNKADVKPGAVENCSTLYDDNCNGNTNEIGAANCADFYYDADNDGYGTADYQCRCAKKDLYRAPQTGDCDDGNPLINPAKLEICGNGIDDNCRDAETDLNASGCTNFYPDEDSDGHGAIVAPKCYCAPSGSYKVLVTGDCDDSKPGVNPDATETCLTLYDDNCNGMSNEENAPNCQIFYYDNDGDGFGVATKTMCLCSAFGKYTASQHGDCGDNNANINPGENEVCFNGYDDNCNLSQNDENASGCAMFHSDQDYDGYGSEINKKCLCFSTGIYTTTSGGDCDDASYSINPSAVEVCENSVDEDCNGQTNQPDAAGCESFYFDGDSDGFGEAGNSICLCAALGSYKTPNAGDCDDANPDVNPGEFETCGNSVDDNCNGGQNELNALGCVFYYYDLDGDNYGISGDSKCYCQPVEFYRGDFDGDCNDLNAAVNPGASEICGNSSDDNCNNNLNDENASGCLMFYYDADGDGWGIGNGKCFCYQSGLYRANNEADCDDSLYQINPGVAEICGNGIDDNCSKSQNDAGSTGCAVFYKDSDNDGFGSPESQCLCFAEGDFKASNSFDCDDFNASVKPSAQETCGNAADENCDGSINGENAVGCTVHYYDFDEDGHGIAALSKCLCAPLDKYSTLSADDCNDEDPQINPDSDETCNEADDDCDSQIDEGEGNDGCVNYLKDSDSDNFGATGDSRCLCNPDQTYKASNGGDCDDSKPGVYPNAPEYCNGLDDDCDNEIDEIGALCINYYYDDDGDGFGVADDFVCDCTPQGKYSATQSGDCDDGNPQANPSKVEKCNSFDDNCNGLIDEENALDCVVRYFDEDADGWGLEGNKKCLCSPAGNYTALQYGDCVDNNPEINPGENEKCDQTDNNCNEYIDEGEDAEDCTLFYYTADTDDFGITGDSKCLCSPGEFYRASQEGDCDDTDGTIFPGAVEICDVKDNDCNTVIDDENALLCADWFYDFDGDGFGATGQVKCLCGPSGYYSASEDGDCLDGNPEINPATQEICNNGDDNCNNVIDDEGASGCTIYYYDFDGDSYGFEYSKKCLCAPTGKFTAIVSGDCKDSNAAVNPSKPERCNFIDDNCNGITDEVNASDCLNFFFDNDNDGYGVTGNTRCLCAAENEYRAFTGGDCYDFDPEISPAAQEKCNGKDDNCSGSTDEEGALACVNYYYDSDQDGVGVSNDAKCLCSASGKYNSASYHDCNDSNPQVKPGVHEMCNGVDDNCDGVTDPLDSPGCKVYYYDYDGDSFGTSDSVCACAPTYKYTALKSGDCNDSNIKVYPFRTELCNTIDDNCNGLTDEENAGDCVLYYFDGDADGFGKPGNSRCLCSPVGSYTSTNDSDCNDADSAIKPNIAENCTTNYDDNCNSSTNEKDASFCNYYFFDSDGDEYGTGSPECWCSPSGFFSALSSGDCKDDDDAVKPFAQEICNGKDDNCDYAVDGENAQGCSTYYFDNDGDGYGTAGNSKCLCAPSWKYTSQTTGDCDDSGSTVYPGSVEKCNGMDDNCNNVIDEESTNPEDPNCLLNGYIKFFYDEDGDGFGKTPSQTKCLCAASGKYSALAGGDCDDAKSFVHPYGSEICGNAIDDNCNGQTDESGNICFYYDYDNDGYGTTPDSCQSCNPHDLYRAVQSGDCDDNDPAKNPSAAENCGTSYDDDCDDVTNEENAAGCAVFYFDFDNDTYGKSNKYKCFCAASGDYRALQGGDCYDNSATAYPGAEEFCGNSIDDDCDGLTDEPGCTGCATYYYDGDNDGYGLLNDTKCLGAPSEKYTALIAGDCRDNDPNVNPGGAENCLTSYDDDCDGETNELNAANCKSFYFDNDNDGYGSSSLVECYCSAYDIYRAAKGGDCNDSAPSVNPDAVEKCNGYDDNCDTLIDPGNSTGCSIFYFDYDSDGYGISDNKCLCSATGKYTSANDDDCNDYESNINPARTEYCNGYDDNCDEITDPENTTGCSVFFYDNDSDGYGIEDDSRCICSMSGKYTAQMTGDCNNNDAYIFPGASEKCNGADDNCNNQTDEGDSLSLCGSVPNAVPRCSDGHCSIQSCSNDWFDVDGNFTTGCECQKDQNEGSIDTCAYAVDMGTLEDSKGLKMTKSGSILPAGDVDWYKFRAVDETDSGSLLSPGYDKFHVRVKFTYPVSNNPLRFKIYRSNCDNLICDEKVDFQWYTNFKSGSYPNVVGESPCIDVPDVLCFDGDGNPTGKPECATQDVNYCSDNTDTYFVKVYRPSGSPANCDETRYTIEVSNGAYAP